jgi:hypothetical protein
MSSSSRPSSDQSLGQLVSSVTNDVSTLLRLEIELLKTELQSQLQQGAGGGAMVALAAFLGFLASILLSFAAVYGLSYVMPVYAAFLTVAGVYLLLAAILGLVARRKFQQLKGPERALAQVDATKATFAEHAEVRAQAKASGVTVDELRAQQAAAEATAAIRSGGSGAAG